MRARLSFFVAGDGRFVTAIVRGDYDVNETKLVNAIKAIGGLRPGHDTTLCLRRGRGRLVGQRGHRRGPQGGDPRGVPDRICRVPLAARGA